MNAPLIVGSIALDSISTPFASVDRVVGGAAIYAAMAASMLTAPKMVGVIGGDFPQEILDVLHLRGADLAGVTRLPDGKSFHWSGAYNYDMSGRETLATELNVFADFNPILPDDYCRTAYCFLANIQPQVQLAVLKQLNDACFVACDTMNLWIDTEREALLEVLARVDLALLNDSEARQLTDTPNLTLAAERILRMGPRWVIIKKGEYGATLISADDHFSIPCYPLSNVVDPTGAGDSFAGGMIGLLAHQGDYSAKALRRAVAMGTIIASACVEDFSLGGLLRIGRSELERRYNELRRIVEFEAFEWSELEHKESRETGQNEEGLRATLGEL